MMGSVKTSGEMSPIKVLLCQTKRSYEVVCYLLPFMVLSKTPCLSIVYEGVKYNVPQIKLLGKIIDGYTTCKKVV